LGSAGNASLFCNLGGRYSFVHSTIANYWSNGFRIGAALQITNVETFASGETLAQDLTLANFTNCIIDGNTSLELLLNSNGTNAFNFSFTNCMLKFRDTNGQFTDDPLYDFENSSLYQNVFLNQETNFLDTAHNDFRIEETSAAIGNADANTALLVPFDILGIDRTVEPAIGAYQYSPEE